MSTAKITFIGAGNMASSMIGGLIAQGIPADTITASDPHSESLERLQAQSPVHTTQDNHAALADADVVVLSVKPQIKKQVTLEIAPSVQKQQPLVISIATGIEIASLENWLGANIAIVRCMPNTPALVQTGATAMYANSNVSEQQKALAEQIMSAVGIALWVDAEAKLDAVTALSGSGPAYFFLVMETMQASGEQLGLSPKEAEMLTLQTALGAAKMAMESDVDSAELRRRVTSPGGTTESALNTFEQHGLRELFAKALTAARDRSEELAKLMGD